MIRALAVFVLVSAPLFSFPETIDPPPLKVKQVCGIAAYANHRIELKKNKIGPAQITVNSDDDGRFRFPGVSIGTYWLKMSPTEDHEDDGTNTYPLRVVSVVTDGVCKKPLIIRPRTDSEAGITIRFAEVDENKVPK